MLLWGKVTKYSQYEEMFELLRRRNITTPQMHMLLVLASRGDEWTSMQDLIKQMQKTRNYKVVQSSVTRSIQTLSPEGRVNYKDGKALPRKKGHDMLEIKNDEVDGRLMYFRLNRKGINFVNDVTNKL